MQPLWRRALDYINKKVEESDRARWKRESDAAEAKAKTGTCTDADLVYAARARCPCGAGLAYPKGIGPFGSWDCSDILTGRAALRGTPKSKQHTAGLPFTFYEVQSENQPRQKGATTRPKAAA